MKVIVVSNCATSTYYDVTLSLFPDWTIKAAGFNEAERWLQSGEKPEFEQYLKECDLYIGWPLDNLHLATVLNPNAERVIIPELYFRGLHPDVAILEGFWGPFSEGAPHTQTSLLALGARAIGKTAEETRALFREDVFERLGYFDLYKSEKSHVVAEFGKYGIQLDEAFDFWRRRTTSSMSAIILAASFSSTSLATPSRGASSMLTLSRVPNPFAAHSPIGSSSGLKYGQSTPRSPVASASTGASPG